MKVTNRLNLPEPFVIALDKDNHGYREHRYSVTELLLPVREIILNRKHADEIERDAADSIPALFGTAVHGILEQNTPLLTHLKSEESFECQFGDDTVSGRADLLDLNELSIIDYKTSSVSKVMRKDFDDWKMQGLMYAYIIFKRYNIVFKQLKFYDMLKDWSKIKAQTSSNYPSSPVYLWTMKLEDSDFDYIEGWIRARLALINHYLETDTLPECTDEERWYTGTTYAVYRSAGDAKAAYLTNDELDAHNYITHKCNGAGEIRVRKGEYLKCKYYCDCCKFCEKGG